jgi:hypothetical protein
MVRLEEYIRNGKDFLAHYVLNRRVSSLSTELPKHAVRVASSLG